MEIPADIKNAVEQASEYYGVDENLIYAIIQVESGFNPRAKGDYDKNGVPQSYGLMQLNLKGAGAGYTPAELLDINTNVNIGTRYLKACLDAFPGDIRTGISAYNQGIGGAKNWGWTRNRSYVEAVLSYYKKPISEVVTTPHEPVISTAEAIVPTDWETKGLWKKTFDKINAGCSIYFIILIIIIGMIVYFTTR